MPSSTNSSINANSKPTSTTTSEKLSKEKTTSPLSSHLRPEQGQDKVSELQNAGIRSAFLSGGTASNFVSAYSRNSSLINRVYEMGLGVDELDSARRNYLKVANEVDANFRELASHIPRGPYIDEIARKIRSLKPSGDIKPQEGSKQTPDRSSSHIERPREDRAPPSSPTTPRSSQPQAVDAGDRNNALSQTPQNNRRSSTLRRQSTQEPLHRYNTCGICRGVGHITTQCHLYHCSYCDTTSPGHFAKYCSRNPFRGIASRKLPPGTLEVVNYQSHRHTTISTSTATPNVTTTIPSSILQPNVANLRTTPHTREQSTPNHTPPRISIANGPTYRPLLAPRKSAPKTPTSVGKLQQLNPSHHNSGRNTSNHSKTHKQRTQQPRYERDDEGCNEFDFDPVAEYNMTGEGNID
jgi:hypothetical protein